MNQTATFTAVPQALDFNALRTANVTRQAEWDPSNSITLAYRGNEMAGEVGEACNVIKKIERERLGIPGSRATRDDLANELADAVICADLIAAAEGIDLGEAIARKFNATSEKHGFTTRITPPTLAVVGEVEVPPTDAELLAFAESLYDSTNADQTFLLGAYCPSIRQIYMHWMGKDRFVYPFEPDDKTLKPEARLAIITAMTKRAEYEQAPSDAELIEFGRGLARAYVRNREVNPSIPRGAFFEKDYGAFEACFTITRVSKGGDDYESSGGSLTPEQRAILLETWTKRQEYDELTGGAR